MVPQIIKNLTFKCGLFGNMIILKSEPPYYAFTFYIYTFGYVHPNMVMKTLQNL
jgi:hypothetical protein